MTDLSRRRFLQFSGVLVALPLLQACSSDKKTDTTTAAADTTTAATETTAAAAAAVETTAAAAVETTAAAAAASLGTATYQLSWLKDSQWVGEYRADSARYWSSQGLTVDMLAGGGDIDPTAVVVAGKALTGPPGTAPIAGAITAGADLKIVATKYQKSPFAIVSRADKPIASIADLKGKKIGVSEFNTVTFSTFLSLNGLTDSDLTIVPYNFDPSPLVNGEIDGLLGFINDEPTSLNAQGVKTATLLLADFGYDVISNAYVVESKTLADPAERAKLVALLVGIVKGWSDVIADPEGLTAPLVKQYAPELDIDPAVATAIVKATTALIVGDGAPKDIFRLSPAKVALSVSLLSKEKTAIDASAFDLTLMDDVYKQIG